MVAISWDELNAWTCGRQFPASDALSVGELVTRIGPIQAQTARSPFIGLAARRPGLTREQITEAYEQAVLVRGSTLRGTVHTSTPAQHAILDPVTRIGQRNLWRRTLKLQHRELEEVWAGIEDYARDEWRTPAELAEHLADWLRVNGEDASVMASEVSRYFSFGHGGLLRRPLKGGWDQQGAPGYRSADAVVDRGGSPEDPPVAAAGLHLAAHGPASRYDIAWWSRLGLREVDRALAVLDAERPLVRRTGPDGREYVDLPDRPAAREERGVRLLPEFDAVFCGYDPKARDRFVSPEHHRLLWNSNNGMVLPPVLVDGRIAGYWRLNATGKTRTIEVHPFGRRIRKGDLADPIETLATALGITIRQ